MTVDHRLALPAFVASIGGKSLLWTGGDAFALYVMIALLRLPPVSAGTVFLAGSIWNAAMDAAWGAALARSRRLRCWSPRIGAVAAMAACGGFTILPWLEPGSLGLAAIAFVLFRTSFALFDVPHNALSVTFAARYGHLRVMRLRTIASSVAGLAVAAAAIPLLASRTPFLSALSVTAIGCIAFVFLTPLRRLLALSTTTAVTLPSPIVARGSGGGAKALRPVFIFSLIHMIGVGMLAMICKITLHLPGEYGFVLTLAPLLLATSRLCGIPLWSAIARRHDVGAALVLAYVASAVAIALLPPALAHGPFAAGTVFVALGVAIGGVAMLIWSAFSRLLEVVDNGAMAGRGALQYGLFTATTKVGLGGSAYFAGWWLAGSAPQQTTDYVGIAALAIAGAGVTLLCGIGEAWRASSSSCAGSKLFKVRRLFAQYNI